jgi:hypothetical protein
MEKEHLALGVYDTDSFYQEINVWWAKDFTLTYRSDAIDFDTTTVVDRVLIYKLELGWGASIR